MIVIGRWLHELYISPIKLAGNVNIVVLNIDGGNVLCLCEYYSIIINNNLMGWFKQIQEIQMFPTSILLPAKISTEIFLQLSIIENFVIKFA